MPNVFPSNIVLNVVFYVLFVGILNFSRFSQIFPSRIFPSRIFSKLKWLKDAGQRQTPCRLFTFASLRLCVIAPSIHCFIPSLNLSFCSFCEQKQRINGAMPHCSTWNTVHFANNVHSVNRSSESMEQCRSASRPISPCMRVGIWGTEADTIASLHLESLRRVDAV